MSMKSKLINLKNKFKSVIASYGLMAAPAMAADGFSKAVESLNMWVVGLGGLAVATVTLCIMWIGYKVLFDGKRIGDMSNVIIGGILITGASGFGAWYMA